jgi:hypothetical protein
MLYGPGDATVDILIAQVRISNLENQLKHAYCGVVGADSIVGLDSCDDYKDWLASLRPEDT